MATCKKSTDQTDTPAKRSRKQAKAEPANEINPQQDLLADSSADQWSEPASAKQDAIAESEERRDSEPTPDGSQSSDPSEQQPARSSGAVNTSVEPEADADAAPDSADSGLEPVDADAASQTWLLVTNHLNVIYMLAAGMVISPAGFSGKHYRDPSSDVPGWIPLFRGVAPDRAIEQAVCEEKYLRPCIAKLDLTQLSGPAQLVAHNGEVSPQNLPLSIGPSTAALLVPAPLPITLVTGLIFRTAEDRKEFEASARNYANVDLTGLRIEVAEQCFASDATQAWPLPEPSRTMIQTAVDQAPACGEAIGGVLAMLYHLANRSELCCTAFRIASGADSCDHLAKSQQDPVLAELGPWIRSENPHPEAPVPARLFWGVVQALVDARQTGSISRPVDVAVNFLNGELAKLQGTNHQPRLERLISDMRSTFGLGGGTISQLFERHKGTLSRPLLLFCLRESCIDLLEFSHPDLKDEELVLAGVLFGVRDGWIGLPVELRSPNGLSQFIARRMFEAECSLRDAQVSLSSVQPRPVPLRELLMRSEPSQSESRDSSLVDVVTRFGWNDCLVSSIRLTHGQYHLTVSSDGLEVAVRGNMSPPVVDIDKTALLNRIAQWPPLPKEQESELRMALGSGG